MFICKYNANSAFFILSNKEGIMKYLISKIKEFFNYKKNKDPDIIDINPDQASLKKVVYWRVIAVAISMITAYWYLGELYTTIEMTLIEALIMTVTHYVYEELWDKKP